jgi:hypothetical protein
MAKTRSIADLRKELARKEKRVAQLRISREKLLNKLATIDREITTLTGAGQAKPPSTSTASPRSLVDYLCEVLAATSSPMKARDIHDAVLAAGYKTKDKRFVSTVGKTLAANPRFARKGRGLYVLASRHS